MSLDYLKSSECRYSIDDLMWVLNNCLEGWPSRESGYTDAPISKSINPHMPHQSDMEILAEIFARIDYCGKAGERLLINFKVAQNPGVDKNGKPLDVVDLVFDCLSDEGKAVMHYISGNCRRINSCDRCPNEKCKKRGRKPCTFAQWITNHRG